MKRILGIAMVLGLVGALTVMAQELKPGKVGVVDLGKEVKFEMVLVSAGKFKMGSPASEAGRRTNETQHEVTLTKPFYMGKYEVTQEQWKSVMGKNPSIGNLDPSQRILGAKFPVTWVSWDDCQEFIKKLNAKTDGGYRLPTEAEWEYACRAGTTTAYSFGDKITPKDANYNLSKPVAVGSYKPNAFGLYDMHGNVREIVEDWYADYPNGAVTDPKGPATGKQIISRGGCFMIILSSWTRSSNRAEKGPADKSVMIGFRLAKSP